MYHPEAAADLSSERHPFDQDYKLWGPTSREVRVRLEDGSSSTISVPFALYVRDKSEAERQEKPLSMVVLCGGYGNTDPKRTHRPYLEALSEEVNPPDIIAVMSMPGHAPTKDDQQLLRDHPEVFGLDQYHSVLQQVLLQLKGQVRDELRPSYFQSRTGGVRCTVVGHSAGAHGLDHQPMPETYKGERKPMYLVEPELPHQKALNAASNSPDFILRQIALAPCGRLAWWLSYLARTWIPLYEAFSWGLPPNDTTVLKFFLAAIHAAPIPPSWKDRADEWSDPDKIWPELVVYLPWLLHTRGLPFFTQDVIIAIPYGEAISDPTELLIKSNTGRVVVFAGTHSNPNPTQVASLTTASNAVV